MDLEILITKYVNLLVKYQSEIRKKDSNKFNINFLEQEKNLAYHEFINQFYISEIDEINNLNNYLSIIINNLYKEINVAVNNHRILYYKAIVKDMEDSYDLLTYCNNNLDDLINKLKIYENLTFGIKDILKIGNKTYKK